MKSKLLALFLLTVSPVLAGGVFSLDLGVAVRITGAVTVTMADLRLWWRRHRFTDTGMAMGRVLTGRVTVTRAMDIRGTTVDVRLLRGLSGLDRGITAAGITGDIGDGGRRASGA